MQSRTIENSRIGDQFRQLEAEVRAKQELIAQYVAIKDLPLGEDGEATIEPLRAFWAAAREALTPGRRMFPTFVQQDAAEAVRAVVRGLEAAVGGKKERERQAKRDAEALEQLRVEFSESEVAEAERQEKLRAGDPEALRQWNRERRAGQLARSH